MQIIPVIDLKDGLVVHARRGDRHAYAPIDTPLSPAPDPLSVIEGLMSVAAFESLYIADLDAIAGRAGHRHIIQALATHFPSLRLWIDAGAASMAAVEAWLRLDRCQVVLGSESQQDDRLVAGLCDNPRIVLSLDFRDDAFLGAPSLLERTELWPRRVIVMTLARVGSAAGPDLRRLAEISRRAGPREIYAAGGVRSEQDLAALDALNIAGVLVATAIHSGAIGMSEYRRQ